MGENLLVPGTISLKVFVAKAFILLGAPDLGFMTLLAKESQTWGPGPALPESAAG